MRNLEFDSTDAAGIELALVTVEGLLRDGGNGFAAAYAKARQDGQTFAALQTVANAIDQGEDLRRALAFEVGMLRTRAAQVAGCVVNGDELDLSETFPYIPQPIPPKRKRTPWGKMESDGAREECIGRVARIIAAGAIDNVANAPDGRKAAAAEYSKAFEGLAIARQVFRTLRMIKESIDNGTDASAAAESALARLIEEGAGNE